MFGKDVASFVRLYHFMSQVIDDGDPGLEKKQLDLRELSRVIRPDNHTAPIGLFGSQDLTENQKVSFLDALLRTLLDDAALVRQARVDT